MLLLEFRLQPLERSTNRIICTATSALNVRPTSASKTPSFRRNSDMTAGTGSLLAIDPVPRQQYRPPSFHTLLMFLFHGVFVLQEWILRAAQLPFDREGGAVLHASICSSSGQRESCLCVACHYSATATQSDIMALLQDNFVSY